MRSGEIVAYAASFTGPVAGNAILAMVSVLAVEWNVEGNVVLLAIPAFMVPFAVIQIFSATISTVYDRRLTLGLGLLVYILGSVGAALSPSLMVFLMMRVLQGVGYAFVAPVLVPIVFDIAGKERQGLAMGYLGSTSTAGVTVGPLLGGLFAEYNWRLAFIAIAVLASVVLVAVLAVFRGGAESPSTRKTTRQSLGKLVSTAKNRDVLLLSATGFIAFASFIGAISYLSTHLGSDAVGMGPGEIGFILMFSGLSGVFISPVAGKLVDRRGTRCCVSVGFVVAAVATITMQFAGGMLPYIALLSMIGFGSSFIWSALLTMLMRADPSTKDESSSIFNSARFMGFAISPVIMAPVYIGYGLDAVFVVCGLFYVICLFLALSTRRRLDRG